MTYIPHSTHDDEARFIVLITDLIAKGELPHLPAWETSVKDEKSRLVRKKQGEKEAKEAEKLAKELGVWDEFYGSGKAGARKGKGNGKKEDPEEEDHSALQALILKKRKNMDGFFDSLASKYAEPEPKGKGKGKKRVKGGEADTEGGESHPQKNQNAAPHHPTSTTRSLRSYSRSFLVRREGQRKPGLRKGRRGKARRPSNSRISLDSI